MTEKITRTETLPTRNFQGQQVPYCGAQMRPDEKDIPVTALKKWEKKGWFTTKFMIRVQIHETGQIAEGYTSAEKWYSCKEGDQITVGARQSDNGGYVIPGLTLS